MAVRQVRVFPYIHPAKKQNSLWWYLRLPTKIAKKSSTTCYYTSYSTFIVSCSHTARLTTVEFSHYIAQSILRADLSDDVYCLAAFAVHQKMQRNVI
jgi:hypothetical protein